LAKKKESGKKRDWPLILLVIVVAIVAALVFVFGPSLFGGGPEFTVIVRYQTQMDSSLGVNESGPGNITVTGNITNIGTKGGTPVVYLTVNTGFGQEMFTIQAAPCLAGAHVAFEWVHHFDLINPTNIKIQCEVEPLSD